MRSFILCTYAADNHILVGMNEFGEIITILSTIDPKTNRTNINFKYAKNAQILVKTILDNKPEMLYMNDGDLLNASDYESLRDANTKIEYRSASLLSETIMSIRTAANESLDKTTKKRRQQSSLYKLPSFRSVKTLIPDLTYSEYASIYL